MQKFLLTQLKHNVASKQRFFNATSAMGTMARYQTFSAAAMRFPNEPDRPNMKTAFPGPATLANIEAYGEISCNKQTHFPVDMQKSIGNYVTDADGNQFLDVFTSIACIGMGYNHPNLLEATKTDLMK